MDNSTWNKNSKCRTSSFSEISKSYQLSFPSWLRKKPSVSELVILEKLIVEVMKHKSLMRSAIIVEPVFVKGRVMDEMEMLMVELIRQMPTMR